MKLITMQQTADYLEDATIEKTIKQGFVIVHFGKNPAGADFVLMNDGFGNNVLTEGM